MLRSGLNTAGLLWCALALALIAGPRTVAAAEKSAAMVIDANTGAVLHNQSGDEPRLPASLTKMMTLYLTFEQIEAGHLSQNTKLTVSERAASVAPSKLELKAGDQITVINAIKALIVKSANDMAVTLAEQIAGSEAEFASLMTRRARQIGMKSTVFKNASGLPDSDQVTTARDMLTLAMRLQDDFPRHYALFSLHSFSYDGKTHRTHNTLMGRFPGMDGIKTGYTQKSGFNLVSSVKTGGKHIVGAVFGGTTASVRNAHMRMLMFQSLDKSSTQRTRTSGPQLIAQARPAKRPAKPVAKPVTVAAAAARPAPAPAPLQRPARKPATNAAAPAAVETAVSGLLAAATDMAEANRTTPNPAGVSASIAGGVPDAAPGMQAAVIPKLDFAALRATLRAARDEQSNSGDGDARRPRGERHAAPPASAPPAATETVIAKAGGGTFVGRPPSTLNTQLASLDGGPAPQSPPGSIAQLVATNTTQDPLPPSTLHEQAQRLGAFETPPAGLGGPSPEASAYDVQIGSFSSSDEAERRLVSAQSSASEILDGHAPMTLPVMAGDKPLYRARFAGFDAKKASAACLELRRLTFDCFVAPSN